MPYRHKMRNLTEVGLLSAFITITGVIKIPGLIPGTEFQLSAPLAVAICATFGFTKYFTAGVLSSIIGLILGTQNLLNVLIALVFRLTAGGMLSIFGTTWPVVMLAGPTGSVAARLALGSLIGKGVIPLLIAAVPGMIYTALAAWPLTLVFRRIRNQTGKVLTNAIQR